jgi:hypothetical protein
LGEIGRVVDDVARYDLMALINNPKAAGQVRAEASAELHIVELRHGGTLNTTQDSAQRAHAAFAVAQIEQFQKDPTKFILTMPFEAPDGPPIGTDDDFEIQ